MVRQKALRTQTLRTQDFFPGREKNFEKKFFEKVF